MKARYSKHYKIAEDELVWLGERAEALAALVKQACDEQLAELEKRIGELSSADRPSLRAPRPRVF